MIALATRTTLTSSYRDTVMPSGHLRGARVGYDVIIPSLMRKLIRSHGGKVEEGVKVLNDDDIQEAVVRDGAQLSYEMSSQFAEQYPNLRIEEIPANARTAGRLGLDGLRTGANSTDSGVVAVGRPERRPARADGPDHVERHW